MITGTHYSGTTWVGRVLAAAPGLAYIHEPFNPGCPAGLCSARFPYWYVYITEDNADDYEPALSETLALRYGVRRELREVRDVARMIQMARDSMNFARWRLRGCRPLVKDPIALLSAEWLQKTFGMDVVVLVRHPAAFALSVKKRNAHHPFDHFLEQSRLMEGPFATHAEHIAAFAKRERDLTEQAALLWRSLVDVALSFRNRHSDWLFVSYEQLARDPEAGFRSICEHVGQPFNKAVHRALRVTTSSKNPTAMTAKQPRSHFRRDTATLVDRWKCELSADEVERIRSWTEPTASAFYTDDDWRLRGA